MIYAPSDDSFLLEEQILKLSHNKTVLDMGSASGIISLAAQKAGAKSILATDIQNDVIKFLKELKIPCIKSNLFDKISNEKRFDIIAFNPPFLPEDKREDVQSKITTTGGKKGDEIILKFLQQASLHLNKGGIILLILSSLTPRSRINALITKLTLKKRVLSHKKIFFESLECWEITT